MRVRACTDSQVPPLLQEPFPFLSEHFARVLPGLAADSKHSLFTQLVKSAEVHGGQKLPKGMESNAKDYLDVHLVRGFFEDFVQKLILEDLPTAPCSSCTSSWSGRPRRP